MINVLVVDDHPITQMGILDLLKDVPDIKVMGSASFVEEALEKIVALQPQVVVLDYKLHNRNGTDVAETIKRQRWPIRVLAFSAYREIEIVREMLKAGAQGYLLKTDVVQEIAHAIRSVARGKKWFSQEIWELLSQDGMAQTQNSPEEEEGRLLTVRQLEIIQRVALGRTDAQIAVELGVTCKAINAQLGRILERLRADNRANAVYIATKKGWI